jgi:hypothetical protein
MESFDELDVSRGDLDETEPISWQIRRGEEGVKWWEHIHDLAFYNRSYGIGD